MSIDWAQGDREARRLWDLSERVVGACIEVHRHVGPGLLESESLPHLSPPRLPVNLSFFLSLPPISSPLASCRQRRSSVGHDDETPTERRLYISMIGADALCTAPSTRRVSWQSAAPARPRGRAEEYVLEISPTKGAEWSRRCG